MRSVEKALTLERNFANGEIYFGEFKEDKFNGKGTFNHANGDVYEGEWVDNIRSGQGTLTLKDGTKFIGEFENGLSWNIYIYIYIYIISQHDKKPSRNMYHLCVR